MDKVEKVLQEIESLEKTWKYDLSKEESQRHSFGRVPEDKNEVALWSVPRSTGELLSFLVGHLKPKIVLELGCSAGYSTLFLAKAAKISGGNVYTTEILEEKIALAKKHFQRAGLSENIILLEEEISSVLDGWSSQRKIDFVFMDADKENYASYLEKLLPLMKKDGLIVVDNAGKVRMADGSLIDSIMIQDFVKDVKSRKNLSSFFLDIDNGLLLISMKS